MKLWMKILMLVAAFGILYVSFARAGLDEVTNDEKYDRLRKINISYQDERMGQLKCYRLPESNTLPDSPFYFLKSFRDDLWIKFSRNLIDKTRIVALMADKKAYEAITLYDEGKTNLAKEILVISKDKIDLSRELVNQITQKTPEIDQLKRRILEAEDFHNYVEKEISLGNKILRCNE